MYPKNVDGLILSGDYKGWFIMIEPTDPHYLILYSTVPLSLGPIEGSIGYDGWAIDEDSIESNLKNIEIHWLSQENILRWIDEKFS